ncbi:MAG TPA: DUF1326 domain-containing protein [Vicinamibacterales bacterium]|nr:DUF1326 domain-containing protein [Vicinamibacterales bacterium]
MRAAGIFAAGLMAIASTAAAGTVTGEYVEARTAEVFAGGCVMSSEAETIGRQAVLAWRIGQGTHDGVRLDGLSVVAAIAGDHNLGIRELGGAAPSRTRAAVIVDERATPQQRKSLISLVTKMARGLVDDVVEVTAAPIQFSSTADRVVVKAGDARLSVQKHVHHDPNCGAMQWFHPLAAGTRASIGFAEEHVFSGASLGTRWSHPHKKSAFVGSFSY